MGNLWRLIESIFGRFSSTVAISQAETLVLEAAGSLLTNIALIGVEDGARLLADARALSSQINAKADATGAEKMSLYLGAAGQLIVELGGNIEHTLVTSVTRTLAELFHQNDAYVAPAKTDG
jgi:hypothetical protein